MPQTKTAAPVLQHRDGKTKKIITCILPYISPICKAKVFILLPLRRGVVPLPVGDPPRAAGAGGWGLNTPNPAERTPEWKMPNQIFPRGAA